MRHVPPDADLQGYEPRVTRLTLPAPGDRHVLAAAIEGGATVLLTFNLKDFPSDLLVPFGISAGDPAGLLSEFFTGDPGAVEAVVDEAHLNLRRAAPAREAFVQALARQRLPGFVTCLQGRDQR